MSLGFTTILSLSNLQIAELIRQQIEEYDQAFPTILEIPSKDHPYSEFESSF